MKNERGITLVVLVATIIILAVMLGTMAFTSRSSLDMKIYYDICSDIELLDEKIALYYLENKDKSDLLEQLPITNEMAQITDLVAGYGNGNVNYNPNNSGTLYKIDLAKLDNLSLKYAEYYMDSESHTVYSARGIKIEGEIYYTVPLAYEKVI